MSTTTAVRDATLIADAAYADCDCAARLGAEWDEAFAALRSAGLEADADHPTAARYRDASNAVNHANRKLRG